MAKLWLMRDEIEEVIDASAEVPVSGTDSSCGFCDSYNYRDKGHHFSGRCPAVIAQKLVESFKELPE